MSIHTFLSNLGITKGRKIILKSGAKANLTSETLDFAELGMTNEGELYIGAIDGSNILINSNSTEVLDNHITSVASTVQLGHVKVGDNIEVASGVISINNASTTQKGVVQIVDNLTTNDSTKALSSAQGYALKQAIDSIGTSSGGGASGGITLADIPDSSMTVRGLMTPTQYTKLNGISSGANFTSVENVLTSTSTTSALSAYQGKVIDDKITAHNSRIYTLENSAPETLNTLGEIAEAIQTTDDALDGLITTIGTKASSADLTLHADNLDIHITPTERTNWNGKADNTLATNTTNGLMSNVEKVKLASISSGANFIEVLDDLTSTSTTSALSAGKGKVISDKIDILTDETNTRLVNISDSVSDLNTTVTAHLDQANKNTCFIVSTVLQSTITEHAVRIAYDAATFDESNMATLGENPRITIKTTGWYLIVMSSEFSNVDTGSRKISFTVNSQDYNGGYSTNKASENMNTTVKMLKVMHLNEGDYLEAFAYQDSGVTLGMFNNEFTIRKLV